MTSSPLFPSRRLLLALVGSALGLTVAGCYHRATADSHAYSDTSESHAFTGTAGDRIGDDYVYYPTYEVYYSPARKEYVYNDGTTWVRSTTPSRDWANDIAGAPYVPMTFHDDPALHHNDIARQYPRTWVAGEPARTANDDVVEGRRSPDDKANK